MPEFIASERGLKTFWRFSLAGAFFMTVVLALGSTSDRAISLICVTVVPTAWLISRRWPQLGVAFHLLAVLLWTAWHVRQPDAFHIRSGLTPFEAFMPIGTLIACGSAVFWGWQGGLVAVTVGILLAPTQNTAQQAIAGGMLFLLVMAGVIVHHLIVQLERARAELTASSRRDPLTRLGNRHAFDQDMKTVPRDRVLVLWDLDNLKHINDTQGHEAGDRYILEFVSALRTCAQPGDGLYRVGGDEFVSLHDGTTPEMARGVIRAVRERFPTVSAGTAPLEPRLIEQALKQADSELYVQKRNRATSRVAPQPA